MLGIGPHSDRYERYSAIRFGSSKQSHVLVYHVPPSKPGGSTRHLIVGWLGVGLWGLANVEPDSETETRPVPEAVRWVAEQSGGHLLAFAVQCKFLGWDDLAAALYARAREHFVEEKSDRPVFAELREIAWSSSAIRLTDRGTDRKEIYHRLSALFKEEPALRTRYNEWLLGALEKTVAPRRSRPGTFESMIDDLTEYGDGPKANAEQTSYWKLAEQGFDAVPALIEHAIDDRLTRAWVHGFNNFPDRRVTVGHLCSRLLYGLSAGESSGGFLDSPPDPATANKWFENAKKLGEEKWLVARALPADGKPIADRKDCPDPVIMRVIGVKYPDRLATIYRARLKRPVEECWNDDYVPELIASKLAREQKIALLEEGAASDDHFHQLFALEGLARLDPVAFRKPLLAALKRIRPRAWVWQPKTISEFSLARLTEAAGDPACWEALATAGKYLSAGSRLNLIYLVSADRPPDREDTHRLARIRFLAQFLDDPAPEVCAAWDGVQVRDHAASRLAVLLQIHVGIPGSRCAYPGETRGSLERFFIRAVVWQAAEKELVRGK